MISNKKIFGIGFGLVAMLAIAGATLAFVQKPAESAPIDLQMESVYQPVFDMAGQAIPGSEGFQGRDTMNEALAKALGISVDELLAAREEARNAALDQAIAEGLISEERGEIMRARAALATTLDKDEMLAQALGMTTEELQAARQEGLMVRELAADLGLDPETIGENLKEAYEAALQQAVADGVISQEQADLLADNPRPDHPSRPGWPGMANRVYNERSFHRFRGFWDAALADVLGISIEELQAARLEALESTLEQAIEEGIISEERAEIILARAALASTIDPDAILAQVLGITLDDLQAARAEGKRLAELAEELDLDLETIRENMAAAKEQAIQQAVEDGLISPEQAELLQDKPGFGFQIPGRGRFGGHRPFTAPGFNGGPDAFQGGINFPVSTDSI